MATSPATRSKLGGQLSRLTVVLDHDLAEHVRVRAFEERTSRSAYVRELVARDARDAAPAAPGRVEVAR
jgi:hypothetical protein